MADESVTRIEYYVPNLGFSKEQIGLTNVVNQTYSFANSSFFAAAIASNYKDYSWRLIRPACEWMDGYVPSIHGGDTGIMSTRIATALINGLARTIVGEKIVFRAIGEQDESAIATLRDVNQWNKKANIIRPIKKAISFSQGIGTSFLKLNIRNQKDVWWDAVRFDNAFILSNANDEVYDAKFLIKTYTDTRPQSDNFFLVEHRFYEEVKPTVELVNGIYQPKHKKGEKIAMVEYQVHRCPSTSLNNTMASHANDSSSLGWTSIPKEVRDLIKKDYSIIRINEPKPLGFTNLGVEVLVNDGGDIAIPTASNLGTSLIILAQADLIMYEIAQSYALRDMYYGKGTVYVPKQMSVANYTTPIQMNNLDLADHNPVVNDPIQIRTDVARHHQVVNMELPVTNPLAGLSDKYEQIPGANPENNQVIVNQFELRPDQWELIQENSLKRIAVKWGMSPKILASFLAQGSVQMTATQIDSEDDISVAWIEQNRANFLPAINRLLETTLNFYGKPTNVEISFASPSIVNKDRILDRAIKKLEAGLVDVDDVIREINPDLDEESLQAKIKKAMEKQQALALAQYNEMNDDGSFGDNNNYDDLGGENLKGSTNPFQG